jgi:hypothetical protein
MVKVVFYTKTNLRKEATFKLTDDDSLELISIKNLNPISLQNLKQDKNLKIEKPLKPIGFGDIVYFITKLFKVKKCSRCDIRYQCLNAFTPIFVQKILTWAYKKWQNKE